MQTSEGKKIFFINIILHCYGINEQLPGVQGEVVQHFILANHQFFSTSLNFHIFHDCIRLLSILHLSFYFICFLSQLHCLFLSSLFFHSTPLLPSFLFLLHFPIQLLPFLPLHSTFLFLSFFSHFFLPLLPLFYFFSILLE